MNSSLSLSATSPGIDRLRFWLLLLVLLLSRSAWGGDCTPPHDMDFSSCVSSPPPECTYAVTSTTTGVDASIIVSNPPSAAAGTFVNLQNDCAGTSTNIICLGLNVVTSSQPWDQTNPTVSITGDVSQPDATVTEGSFNLRVTDGADTCERTYKIHVTSSGGGWGDPHITTVDGVHYDFQSAGEFIALKGDGIEIQTRQSPVSTQNPSVHKYDREDTGLRNCVSIYTAVAAKVGDHRVTIQPNISGVPDPSGMQIRVDGKLRTLGPDGIDLSSCDCPSAEIKSDGRIVRSADEETIEIQYANGTKLKVTPHWWESQQKWYLNVNVYDTTATKGIMGLTKDNWLPELSNGETVGERAEDLHELYVQLYETFADSWRVGSDDSETNRSLFDYAPGTSTADFTLEGWPRENPANCLIEDEPVAEPVDEAVAEEACSEVVDENNRENCIFDVSVTGYTGFADAYVRSEQLTPGATRTTLVQDKNTSKPGTNVTFTATVQRSVYTVGKITSGVVQFLLDGSNVGDPINFDVNGNAVWSTSSLSLGSHEVEARFLPSGFGERFRPSSSKVSHVVSRTDKLWFSFHPLGSTTPNSNFGDDYDGSYGAFLDLEYRKTPDYSYLGMLGYNHFKGARTGVDDTYWINLSANIKYYLYRLTKFGRVWANGGVGVYQPKSGSTRAGYNFGLGFGGDINPRLRWEVGINYHNIFTSGSDTQFTVPTVGVTYNF